MVSQFSIWQHVLDPFHVLLHGEEKTEFLTSREKVQIVALAILAGIAAVFLPKQWIFTGLGVTFFYLLTAYYKVSYLKQHQDNEGELEVVPSHLSPLIEKQQSTEYQEFKAVEIPLISFFNETLKPHLEAASFKAADPNLCFIKNNTAPVQNWFQNEYPIESVQKTNFQYLREKCPEIDQGLFISIRGDGDCAYRSFGAGLMLQSLLVEGHPKPHNLIEKFKQIALNLQKQTADFSLVIKAMQNQVDTLRQQAQSSEDVLEEYRLPDGKLNEEGQRLKATLDEKRDQADILANHIQILESGKNQESIQKHTKNLEEALAQLEQAFSCFKEEDASPEIGRKMIELMEQSDFDACLIAFLRQSAALNIVLNMEKMGNYTKQLVNQEQVVSGEITLFELLLQRADARQPSHDYLQGSINEVQSLNILFQQPVHVYRCEVYYEPKDKIIHSFEPEESAEQKRQFYILNRPGHCDLILV